MQAAAFFKDASLAGHGLDVYAEMSYWLEVLSAYSDTPTFAALSNEARIDIGAARAAIRLMVNRALAGNDYFGNSPGWTPLLSFEVAYAAFEQEIEFAINTLYLNDWMGNSARDIVRRREAMTLARKNAAALVVELIGRYTKADADFQAQQPLAADNAKNIMTQQEKLRELDEKLLRQADEAVNPLWKKITSCTLKSLGTIACVIPYCGPIGGALKATGRMIDTIKGGSAPQDWNKIIGMGLDASSDAFEKLADIAKDESSQAKHKSSKAKMERKMREWGKKFKKRYEKHEKDSEGFEKLEDVSEFISGGLKGVSEIMTEIHDTFSANTASMPEVQQELDRLHVDNEEFKNIKAEVEKLITARGDIATKLLNALSDIETIPSDIAATIAAITDMDRALSVKPLVIDLRTLAYLREMDNRARERLLLYHYYLSKAYEYRLLQQYPGQLDLTKLFDQFREIADAAKPSTSLALSPAQFNALKLVYQEQLSTVAQSILIERQKNAPKFDTSVGFEFSQSLLDAINTLAPGESIPINFAKVGLFPNDKENLRFKFVTGGAAGITVDAMLFSVLDSAGNAVDPQGLAVCNTEFEFIHSGESRLQLKGKPFAFVHYQDSTATPLKWVLKCDAKLQTPNPITGPASSQASLLGALISKSGDLDLYCYPAADAVINIKKGSMNAGGRDAHILLRKLIVKLDYEYNPVPSGLKILDVSTAGDLTPDYLLSVADTFERRDGQGAFRRVFEGGAVTVTAPVSYTGAPFAGWTSPEGNLLCDKPAITLNASTFPNGYKAIQANYAAYGAVGAIAFDASGKASQPCVSVALSGAASLSTRSLSDGTFAFANLKPGVYTATPSMAGVTFVPGSRRFELLRGQLPMTTTIPDFRAIDTPCSIAGTVSGVTGATVSLSRDGAGEALSAAVGTEGKYCFDLLAPGAYTIVPTKVGFGFSPASRNLVVTTQAQAASGIDFTGSPLATFAVRGVITGNGAEGVVVTLRDGSGLSAGEAACGADGSFHIPAVLPGLYGLTPEKPGFSFSPADLPVQVVASDVGDLCFSSDYGVYGIRGRVRVDDGTPLKGVAINANLKGAVVGSSTTDDTGAHSISGLKPGLYTVRPAKAATSFAPPSKAVSVSAADIPGVDFTVSAKVAGRLFSRAE